MTSRRTEELGDVSALFEALALAEEGLAGRCDEDGYADGVSAFSVSAYRVLFILLVLVQQRSLSLDELNARLLSNPVIAKAFNGETITKYVNTLRSVGCHIPRAKNRFNFHYQLHQSPVPLTFEMNQLLAAHQMLKMMASQPDEQLHIAYSQLLQEVAWAVGDESQAIQLFDSSVGLPDKGARVVDESRQRLSHYRKLCQEGHVLEVVYSIRFGEGRPETGSTTITVEPFRVVQQGSLFYLMGVDRKNLREVKLNLACILDYKVLPIRVRNRPRSTTVTFRITGRLSKTYRLYPGELVLERRDEAGKVLKEILKEADMAQVASLLVKTKTDDVEGLLSRLLRYGQCCEVVSPSYVRAEMAERVSRLLDVFNANPEAVSLELSANPCLFSSSAAMAGEWDLAD